MEIIHSEYCCPIEDCANIWTFVSHTLLATGLRSKKKKPLNYNPTLRNPLENLVLRNSVLKAARSSNQLIYQSSGVACLFPRSQQEIKIILMGQTTNLRISKKICITTLCKTVNGWWWSGQCFDAPSNTFLCISQILRFLNLASTQ